mgnify:FL=1
MPHQDILSYEEITEVVRVAAKLGVRYIRLTGGEPLVRKNLPELVGQIAQVEGIEDISLTTNAALLAVMAEPLAKAGLTRVNISLDTINPEKFNRITRLGHLEQVWEGIQVAEANGLSPIKINAVAVRGVNDDELMDMALLTIEHPWQVRFIEVMPVGNLQDWGEGFPAAEDRYLSVQTMRDILSPLGLISVDNILGNGPARVYQIPGAKGYVGFISPLGEHFCGQCNRLRLTADGRLMPCLLSDLEIPIREVLRRGEDIEPYLRQAVQQKPEGHLLGQHHYPTIRKMSQIGG